jgi:formylmethanofuran dehydrogenase subunit D
VIELNASDMRHFRLRDGDYVRLKSDFGAATAKCQSSDVPDGMAFMAFGPVSNRLIGSETYASGMPDSKYVIVELEAIQR